MRTCTKISSYWMLLLYFNRHIHTGNDRDNINILTWSSSSAFILPISYRRQMFSLEARSCCWVFCRNQKKTRINSYSLFCVLYLILSNHEDLYKARRHSTRPRKPNFRLGFYLSNVNLKLALMHEICNYRKTINMY